jgi:hypothetical protein
MLVFCASHLLLTCNKERDEAKFSTFSDDCIDDKHNRQCGRESIRCVAKAEPLWDQQYPDEEAQSHSNERNYHYPKSLAL